MLNGDQIFAAADKAVGDEVIEVRSDLIGRWRGVVPNDLGLNGDNWLKMSGRMVAAFSDATGLAITMSEPTRATFRKRRLVNLVVAIANLGDKAARKSVKTFEFAGW